MNARHDHVPTRDPAMFYGLLGDVALTASSGRHTEADPVGILVSLLAGVGALAGPRPHVQIGGTRHPLLVWPLLLGTTSTGRKGEATGYAVRFLRSAPELGMARISVSGLSSGEGLIERIRDPTEVRHGKDVDMVGTLDKRLYVTEPEFGSVLIRARREGSTLSGILRMAWEGGDLSVMNRQQISATTSHVAIVGHITPREFAVRRSEVDMAGGLFNRFLPVWVERSRQLPLPEPVPEQMIRSTGDRLAVMVGRASGVGEITLDAGARELWVDSLYSELGADDGADSPATDFVRRVQPYARRIAALYAALDRRDVATLADITAAAALCRYAIASASYVLGIARRDPRVDRVRRAVIEAPAGLTRNEIREDVFGRNMPSKVLDTVLAELAADEDIAVLHVHDTGGRPRTVYVASSEEVSA